MSGELDLAAEKQRTAHFHENDWMWTIIARPELEAICPWEKITGDWDWYEHEYFWYPVLMARPRMIKHAPSPFPAEYLDATRWAKILLFHPELGSKVPWEEIKRPGDKEARLAWMRLLVCHPRFAKHCHWEMFYSRPDQNNPNEWIKLLQQQPRFITEYLRLKRNHSPDDPVVLISPTEWAHIVAVRPELLSYAPVRRFTEYDWRIVVEKQPRLCPKRLAKKLLPAET